MFKPMGTCKALVLCLRIVPYAFFSFKYFIGMYIKLHEAAFLNLLAGIPIFATLQICDILLVLNTNSLTHLFTFLIKQTSLKSIFFLLFQTYFYSVEWSSENPQSYSFKVSFVQFFAIFELNGDSPPPIPVASNATPRAISPRLKMLVS